MSAANQHPQAYRAAVVHFFCDPGENDHASSYEYLEDGLLVVENGRVRALGPAAQLLPTIGEAVRVHDLRGCLISPGFVDAHVHYPQTDVIASAGRQLLDWLEDQVFPEEAKFSNAEHATTVAEFFCDELLRNGTTTALVYGTVHKTSVDAFFAVAAARGMRMVAGKVLMDRNCPAYLRDTAQGAYADSVELIERWDGQERLNYAITPRFAVTSSLEQFESIARLAREYPDVHVHTHLAENKEEIALVQSLFPWSRSYLDVYDRYGLLRPRAIYAHCIHLDERDRRRMGQSGAAAAFCPTSNLYLGSGLFDIAAMDAAQIPVALATDVGAGTSFSLLRTMGEAYKVAQLRQQRLTPLRALYLSTLGGARMLGLQDHVGNFEAGREADFVVLDPNATPLMARRSSLAQDLTTRLRVLMTLGDDRAVRDTYVLGRSWRNGADQRNDER